MAPAQRDAERAHVCGGQSVAADACAHARAGDGRGSGAAREHDVLAFETGDRPVQHTHVHAAAAAEAVDASVSVSVSMRARARDDAGSRRENASRNDGARIRRDGMVEWLRNTDGLLLVARRETLRADAG